MKLKMKIKIKKITMEKEKYIKCEASSYLQTTKQRHIENIQSSMQTADYFIEP